MFVLSFVPFRAVTTHSEVTYIEVIETQETIYDIYYELTEAGEYDMDIKFGGKKIPNGAFTIKVQRV